MPEPIATFDPPAVLALLSEVERGRALRAAVEALAEEHWDWKAGQVLATRLRALLAAHGVYRGPVAIHAGLAPFEQDNPASRAHAEAHGTETSTDLVFGAIIGVANLWAVHEARSGCCPNRGAEPFGSRWAMADHWHLCLTGSRPLPRPIPYRGALGLWTVPDDIGEQLLAHLDPTHDRAAARVRSA